MRDRRSLRSQRVAALQAELDIQGQRSADRTRTIETKAAYTTTAAAAVVAASVAGLGPAWSDLPILAPLVLAGLTIFFSTRALVPLSLAVVSVDLLVTKYNRDDMPLADLQRDLLQIRKRETEHRDALNFTRARSMKLGFRFLTASVIALVLSTALSGIAQSEGGLDGPAREAEPGQQTSITPGP